MGRRYLHTAMTISSLPSFGSVVLSYGKCATAGQWSILSATHCWTSSSFCIVATEPMLSKSANLPTMSSATSLRQRWVALLAGTKAYQLWRSTCNASASSKKASAAFMLFLGSVGTLVWLMEFFSWKSEIDQKMSGVHLGVIVNT